MPEAALPMDSELLMVFDGDHGGDFGDFLDLVESFPKLEEEGVVEQIWSSDSKLPEYAKYVRPVFEDNFRVALGVSGVGTGQLAIGGSKDPSDVGHVQVVAYFENSDAFEELMKEVLKMNDVVLKESEEDGKTFWTDDKATFIARDGDIFVFAMTKADLDIALAHLEKGDGFKALTESGEKLGYVHVGGNFLSEMLTGVYGESDLVLSGSTVFFTADDRGLAFDSEMDLPADDDKEEFEALFGELDYRLDLIKEVRAENPIAYTELSSLKQYFDAMAYGVLAEVNKVDPSANPVPPNYDLMASVAEKLGMDAGALTEFIDSPMAFVMGDSGTLYPTMAFYMGMDKGDLETARSLTVKMDSWMAALIQMYDELAAAQGLGEGALKREIAAVGGSGLHKLYFDMSALPEDVVGAASLIPGLDLANLKVELYYGLTSEDHFVIALYPDFAEAYASAPIVGDDAGLKAALKDFDLDNAYTVNAFMPPRFIEIVDRWMALVEGSGFVPAEDLAKYDFYAHEVGGRFESMVSVGSVEGGKVKSRGRLEIKN